MSTSPAPGHPIASMSFVALALLAQANLDDLRAVHGLARTRQAYVRIGPGIEPLLTSPFHDDVPSLTRVYGEPTTTFPAVLVYALATSGGMIGLITSMVGGVLTSVLVMLGGVTSDVGNLFVGIGGAMVVFAVLIAVTLRNVPRAQERLGGGSLSRARAIRGDDHIT